LIDLPVSQAMLKDDPLDRPGSSVLHVPPPWMAFNRIFSRFKQALTGRLRKLSKPRRARQMHPAGRKSAQRAHLASHVSHAHRVNRAFSVLQGPKLALTAWTAQPLRSAQPLWPTTARSASMETNLLLPERRIQHLRCRAQGRNATNVAHVAIVVAVAGATHAQAQMIATAHANRASLTTPTLL
jgi:hypothetical protein